MRPTKPGAVSPTTKPLLVTPPCTLLQTTFSPVTRHSCIRPRSSYALSVLFCRSCPEEFQLPLQSDHPFNQEVIREIEEEAEEPGADDDIVLLRSPTADQRQQTVNDEDHSVCIGVL